MYFLVLSQPYNHSIILAVIRVIWLQNKINEIEIMCLFFSGCGQVVGVLPLQLCWFSFKVEFPLLSQLGSTFESCKGIYMFHSPISMLFCFSLRSKLFYSM